MSSSSPITRLAFALAVPALALAASASAAHANVRSVSNSSACQFEDVDARRGFSIQGGDATSTFNKTFYTSYDIQLGISHQHYDTNVLVQCNVPRNLPLSTAGLSDLELRFRSLVQFDVPRSITCYAISQRTDGTIAAMATRTISMAGNYTDPTKNPSKMSTYATMDFGNSINLSVAKGLYAVSCYLPSDVGLLSVYSSEIDGIDGN
jgi:hypothetical protein